MSVPRSSPSEAMPGRRLSALIPHLLTVVAVLGLAGAKGEAEPRRLQAASTSNACRTALEDMLRNKNWLFMNDTMTRWCRIKLENEFTNCCGLADFYKGKAEGCSNCDADCIHAPFDKFCNTHYGQACLVTRSPFFQTGAQELQVKESFCVPEDCNNAGDRDALMTWYATLYRSRRGGWHQDYDKVTLECPSNTLAIIMWTLFVMVLLVCLVPVGFFLFKAPKERGRTLISQADMQEMNDSSQVEAIDNADLRGAAQGQDALGNSGMSRSR